MVRGVPKNAKLWAGGRLDPRPAPADKRGMRFLVLSDTALQIELAATSTDAVLDQVLACQRHLEAAALPGVREVVPGLTGLGVHLEADAVLGEVQQELQRVLAEDILITSSSSPPRERVIPVCYGGEQGPDLERVAACTGLSPAEVVAAHVAGEYRVAALGFAPGFPYLEGMDAALSCPRLDTPRLRVPAGAVGIGRRQTGVYPQASPGGWNLIGRTDQRLFDPHADEPAWLRAGDRVRFVATDETPGAEPVASSTPPSPDGAVDVLEGGLQTTVQDLGRWGWQHIGVTVGGALDPATATVANLLVGNPPGTPVLEWALRGPHLRFRERCIVALMGGRVPGLACGRPLVVEAGEELDLCDPEQPSRGWLAVSGGWAVEPIMGSASTHLTAGFGGWQGRALRAGDRLPVGPAYIGNFAPGWSVAAWSPVPLLRTLPVRVLRGPDLVPEELWQAFLQRSFVVSPASDRRGLRLQGEALDAAQLPDLVSQPVSVGTVQLPPDGLPVILAADRQVLGGYPRLASVISADWFLLAQAVPGTAVRFYETDLAEAEALRHEGETELRKLAMALRPRLEWTA